jgi:hypothetical protein
VVHIQHDLAFLGAAGTSCGSRKRALPMVITFHTVCPAPAAAMKDVVLRLSACPPPS